MTALQLKGDDNVPSIDLKESEVNHLRSLLAWMRCEYSLDESFQKGYVDSLSTSIEHGITNPDVASKMLKAKADEINNCPQYVRNAVKQLTKAIKKHEEKNRVFDVTGE